MMNEDDLIKAFLAGLGADRGILITSTGDAIQIRKLSVNTSEAVAFCTIAAQLLIKAEFP